MSDLDEFRSTYFEECAELLTELEEQFAAMTPGAPGGERIHAAFRAIHSIKGGAGAFGFAALVQFSHAYETLLDRMREGGGPLSPGVIALCVRANDVVSDLVASARTGSPLPADHGAYEAAQIAAMSRESMNDEYATDEVDIESVPRVMVGDKDDPAPDDGDSFSAAPLWLDRGTWEISFAPHPELYARANEPLLLFRELALLGDLSVKALLRPLPPLTDFDPFGVYCTWELTLASATATESEIREIFEFVEGICDLTITELVTLPEPAVRRSSNPAQDRMPPFEDEAPAAGAVALPPTTLHSDVARPEGVETDKPGAVLEIAPFSETATAEAPEPAARPAEIAEERHPALHSIRVDLEKVDRVVNMVGELVITQSMLTQQLDDTLRAGYQEMVRGLEVLAQTTRELQDAVMAIRAQPVKSVFARMPRVIRELAEKTGKKLRLETSGEATEIDKTVVEQLVDPLMHMVRNAADHGIESPGLRIAAGKPEIGTIRISAEQAGGNIIICVEDDGAGINRARVLEVAHRRGLVAADAQLSPEQIDNLVFAPGFSTVETVSDISGRGVGMDVVLSNVTKMGGSVYVKSWPGRGTRATLRLPLTLAVLDVMVVEVAGGPYLIPLSAIIETQQVGRAALSHGPSGAAMLRFRGEYVQVIDLAESFGLNRGEARVERFVVLCEVEAGVRIALVVEDIIGQQQVVIKSVEQNFESIPGIAGGTILGDGSVALIIDVQEVRSVSAQRRAA